MSAATVQQAAVMLKVGAPRVMLANEIVGRANIRWLERLRHEHPEQRVLALVDSVESIELLTRHLPEPGPLPVLLELGFGGQRCGVRDENVAAQVAAAVVNSPRIHLAGLETYEGAVAWDRSNESLSHLEQALTRSVHCALALEHEGLFPAQERVIFSAGGSQFFNRVLDAVSLPQERFLLLVRAGAYVAHDDGHYQQISPLPFQPAIELWADVISAPNPGLIIAGFGKRDAPIDLALPVVKDLVRDGTRRSLDGACRVQNLNDHHAFLELTGDDIRVGDVLVLGISHPCTALDRWSAVAITDDDDRVIDIAPT